MSSYYPSFSYLDKNSADEGYIVTAFEPDNGFVDTFLGMDQVYEDYFDGTKRFLYGARYNNKATINITLVKADGTDWTVNDNRNALRWLTGPRSASWLDLCARMNEAGKWVPAYSFLGTVTDAQQYKLDGRVVGLQIVFTSISPWAYSAEDGVNRPIHQGLGVTDQGVLYGVHDQLSIDNKGILYNGADPVEGNSFCFKKSDGTLYVENIIRATFNNQTDDLQNDIYLDIIYTNEKCTWLKIKRKLDDIDDSDIDESEEDQHYEIAKITNLQPDEVIKITGKQFIVSYVKDQDGNLVLNPGRPIFGDDFNFVWPKLTPGVNKFIIEGDGNGHIEFSYRYPMKVGDCAMDISTYGGDVICGSCDDIPSYDTVRWQDITGVPRSLAGYGITDAYTKVEVDAVLDDKADKATTLSGYGITDAYTKSDVYNKNEVYSSDMVYTKEETYNKAETYNKDEIYTKVEVDDKIEDIEISGGVPGTGGPVKIDEDELNKMLEDILS